MSYYGLNPNDESVQILIPKKWDVWCFIVRETMVAQHLHDIIYRRYALGAGVSFFDNRNDSTPWNTMMAQAFVSSQFVKIKGVRNITKGTYMVEWFLQFNNSKWEGENFWISPDSLCDLVGEPYPQLERRLYETHRASPLASVTELKL